MNSWLGSPTVGTASFMVKLCAAVEAATSMPSAASSGLSTFSPRLNARADAEPLHAWQHLIADQRQIVQIVHEPDGHAVEAGIAQRLEGSGDLVGAADHRI